MINVSFAGSVVVRVVTHGMGGGHPAKKLAHLAVTLRPQHQVPVVGHQLERKQLDRVPLEPLREDSLKGREIFVFAEDRGPAISPVEDMIQSARFIGSRRSWHAKTLSEPVRHINES